MSIKLSKISKNPGEEVFRITLAEENPDVETANVRYERAYRYDVQRMNYRRSEREDRERTQRANEARISRKGNGMGELLPIPSSLIEHEGIH